MFFFFKQTTAYEMRISDWSSDVCSSDLAARPNTGEEPEAAPVTAPRPVHDGQAFRLRGDPPSVMRLSRKALASVGAVACLSIGGALVYALLPARHADAPNLVETERSEEHTSELQSLMRNSYAVFSLKKKNQHTH